MKMTTPAKNIKKIIALCPIRNEEWILPTFFSGIAHICDEVIILDDNSTDKSVAIAKKHAAHTYHLKDFTQAFTKNKEAMPMSFRRQTLLELGRKHGGTHFIWLDADECLSTNFTQHKDTKQRIHNLVPGQKMFFRWISLWKDVNKYRDDGGFYSNSFKDIIHADNGDNFTEQFLSESRTPGNHSNNGAHKDIKVNQTQGVCLHFQYVAFERFLIKQAWYRCKELLFTTQRAVQINYNYATTLDQDNVKCTATPKTWLHGLAISSKMKSAKSPEHLKQIREWFSKYGISYFEHLQIWQIESLKKEFIKRVGRKPGPEKLSYIIYRAMRIVGLN